MARWEPDARGRLMQAAIALYDERGYDATTVAEIAARAGLTERSFFRHFSDKREVLFGPPGEFEALVVGAAGAAPPELAPLDVAAEGLLAAASMLQQRREFARVRARIIASSPELRERELAKLA